MQNKPVAPLFSAYQRAIIAMLAFIQFTVILDFMVLSPLSAQLLAELHITTVQFGWVVSAYAFSAGIAGLLAAGFADRFDRKKFLLFFYTGFLLGTFLCGIAPDYHSLLAARIVTGVFGGVIGSVSFAIVTDLFDWQVRGRVMGFVQMSFAASQILGIPVGLYLANQFGWHSPFLLIVAVGIVVGIAIMIYMKPVITHLALKTDRNAFQHLFHTVSQPIYLQGFAATMLLASGGFMLMPFGGAFSINNLGVVPEKLPFIYLITGFSAILIGPLAGKLSDKIGKYSLFSYASALGMIICIVYCNLGPTSFWEVVVLNGVLFSSITGRMVSASALMSAVPEPQDRGAFMGVNASVQQLAGGLASLVAGLIVVQAPDGSLQHYGLLGYVVAGSMAVTVGMMYFINQIVEQKQLPDLHSDQPVQKRSAV